MFLTTRLPVALFLRPDWLLLWLETLLPLSFHRMRWLGGDVTGGGGCWDGKCGGGQRRSGSAELQQHRQVAERGNRLLLPTWERLSTRWGVAASLPRSRHTSRSDCCFCTTASLMSVRETNGTTENICMTPDAPETQTLQTLNRQSTLSWNFCKVLCFVPVPVPEPRLAQFIH